jgi:DNA-binding GntR family transcriptional regulator
LKLNQSFHFAVYSLAENRALMKTIEGLWLQAGPILSPRKKGEAMVPGHQNHIEIIDNLEEGKGSAAADALQRDIVEAHDQIFALLDGGRFVAAFSTSLASAIPRSNETGT